MSTSGSSSSGMETLTRIAEALLQPEVDQLLGVCRGGRDDAEDRDPYYYPTATTVWNSSNDSSTLDSFPNYYTTTAATTTMHWNDVADDNDKATAATEEESESESEEEEAEGVLASAVTAATNLPNKGEASWAEDGEMMDSGGDDDSSMDEDEDAAAKGHNNDKYWLDPDWVPTDRAGNQIQPDKIRQQLVRYLKQTQKDGSMTKTAFLKKLGVNANSFNKFVSPNQYVGNYNERSKLNSTYMNGARFLEAERNKDEENGDDSEDDYGDFASPVATTTKSRTTTSSSRMKGPKTPSIIHAVTPAAYFSQKVTSNNKKKVQAAASTAKAVAVHKKTVAFKTPRKTSTTSTTTNGNSNRNNATALMKAVNSFRGDDDDGDRVSETSVYDSPATVARQIKTFLREHGVSNSRFSASALQGVNRKSLRRFLDHQKRGSIVYGRAWQFFERLRLLRGEPKSQKRLANERRHPRGLQL